MAIMPVPVPMSRMLFPPLAHAPIRTPSVPTFMAQRSCLMANCLNWNTFLFIIIGHNFSSRPASFVLVRRILLYETICAVKPKLASLAQVGNSLCPVVGVYSCQSPVVVSLGEFRIKLNGSGIVVNGLGLVLARCIEIAAVIVYVGVCRSQL